jgi:beta-lactamase class A
MYPKQKHLSFDIFLYVLFISVALTVWTISRSLALLVPTPSFASNNTTEQTPISSATSISPETLQLKAIIQLKTDLQKSVSNFVLKQPSDFGIFIKHLPTGITASSSENQQFISASMYKPFAAIEALKLVDSKQLSLDKVLADTGGRNVKSCIWDSITISDNYCGRALRSITGLGTPKGLALLRADGYMHTDMRGDYPVSTASDIALMFEHIYDGDLLSKSSNQLLIDALLDQQVKDRLPLGLDENSILAHKTGDLEGAAHDGGIVYKPAGDYIIVVLSGPDSSGRTLQQRYDQFSLLASETETITF